MNKGKGILYAFRNYETLELIATYMQWIIGIATLAITVRALCIIKSSTISFDESVDIHGLLAKLSNLIKAVVIMVSAQSIIELLKRYLF